MHHTLCIKALYDIAVILLGYGQSFLGDFDSLSLHPETTHITRKRGWWVACLGSLTVKAIDVKIYEKLTTEVNSLC